MSIARASRRATEKALSIREAFKAVEDEHGPVSFEQGDPVEAPADETEEAKAEREATEAEKAAAKAEKKAAKAAKPDAEDKEEPVEKVGVRDLIKEREKLREKEARREQYHARRAQALERDYQGKYNHLANVEQKLAPLMDAAKAVEVGDFDGIAQAIGKFLGNEDVKDWKALNSEALKAIQSPMYKRIARPSSASASRTGRRRPRRTSRSSGVQQEPRCGSARSSNAQLNITDELSDDERPRGAVAHQARRSQSRARLPRSRKRALPQERWRDLAGA